MKLCDEFVIILAFILMEFGQKGKMWKLLPVSYWNICLNQNYQKMHLSLKFMTNQQTQESCKYDVKLKNKIKFAKLLLY